MPEEPRADGGCLRSCGKFEVCDVGAVGQGEGQRRVQQMESVRTWTRTMSSDLKATSRASPRSWMGMTSPWAMPAGRVDVTTEHCLQAWSCTVFGLLRLQALRTSPHEQFRGHFLPCLVKYAFMIVFSLLRFFLYVVNKVMDI